MVLDAISVSNKRQLKCKPGMLMKQVNQWKHRDSIVLEPRHQKETYANYNKWNESPHGISTPPLSADENEVPFPLEVTQQFYFRDDGKIKKNVKDERTKINSNKNEKRIFNESNNLETPQNSKENALQNHFSSHRPSQHNFKKDQSAGNPYGYYSYGNYEDREAVKNTNERNNSSNNEAVSTHRPVDQQEDTFYRNSYSTSHPREDDTKRRDSYQHPTYSSANTNTNNADNDISNMNIVSPFYNDHDSTGRQQHGDYNTASTSHDADHSSSTMNQAFAGTAESGHNQHPSQHHQHYGYYSHPSHPSTHYPPHGYYPPHGPGDSRKYYQNDHQNHQAKPSDVPSSSTPYGYNHGTVADTPRSAHGHPQHHGGYFSHSNENEPTPYPYPDSYGSSHVNSAAYWNHHYQGHPNKRNFHQCDYTNSMYDPSGMNQAPQDDTSYRRPAKKRSKKRPDDMPRYPLSAYNFFFSEEREVVLAMLPLPSSVEEEGDSQSLPDNIESTARTGATSSTKEALNSPRATKDVMPKFDSQEEELQYIKMILSTRKMSKDQSEELQKKIKANTKRILDTHLEGDKVKKSHKKTHGKITFQVLSKLIGQRWRDISEADFKQYYFDLAKKDMDRYNKQMEKYEEGSK